MSAQFKLGDRLLVEVELVSDNLPHTVKVAFNSPHGREVGPIWVAAAHIHPMPTEWGKLLAAAEVLEGRGCAGTADLLRCHASRMEEAARKPPTLQEAAQAVFDEIRDHRHYGSIASLTALREALAREPKT